MKHKYTAESRDSPKFEIICSHFGFKASQSSALISSVLIITLVSAECIRDPLHFSPLCSLASAKMPFMSYIEFVDCINDSKGQYALIGTIKRWFNFVLASIIVPCYKEVPYRFECSEPFRAY